MAEATKTDREAIAYIRETQPKIRAAFEKLRKLREGEVCACCGQDIPPELRAQEQTER